MTYHPASLHTIEHIASQYDLSERQVTLLRKRLNGKAVQLGPGGVTWFRWCDVLVALREVAEVDAYLESLQQV